MDEGGCAKERSKNSRDLFGKLGERVGRNGWAKGAELPSSVRCVVVATSRLRGKHEDAIRGFLMTLLGGSFRGEGYVCAGKNVLRQEWITVIVTSFTSGLLFGEGREEITGSEQGKLVFHSVTNRA